ncbi:MAG: DDE-type integrase/transposase/recombinase [Bacillota bacterium]|jgi:putative transposase
MIGLFYTKGGIIMLDEATRNAIALKKFSIISPLLNGQVEHQGEYCAQVASSVIDMPHYGLKNYSPKTISSWYTDYLRLGIDALKPKPRTDKGGTRKVTPEISDALAEKCRKYPKAPATVIYDMMVKEGFFLPADLSLSTLTRYLNRTRASFQETSEIPKDMKRFAHGKINQLWQTDVMYGPYIKKNGKKVQTYLLAFIDDHSRLILHAQFYYSQDFLSLRHSFREAVLRRGIPKLLYTDNGKIYRCANFEYLCANLGISLLRAEPFTPTSKGKIERFFRSCRLRFLSTLETDKVKDLDHLNSLFWEWLSSDYNEKSHSSLGMSPLDSFLAQAESVILPTDLSLFNEKFLVKASRTIKHDATLSLNCILYETSPVFAGRKVDVRYDPDLLERGLEEIFLYSDDKCIGTAKKVRFSDNANMKRKGRPSAAAKKTKNIDSITNTSENASAINMPKNTISFSAMDKKEATSSCSLNSLV